MIRFAHHRYTSACTTHEFAAPHKDIQRTTTDMVVVGSAAVALAALAHAGSIGIFQVSGFPA